jgi:hypothetical protein
MDPSSDPLLLDFQVSQYIRKGEMFNMNDREPQEIEATGQTSGSKGDATRDVETSGYTSWIER